MIDYSKYGFKNAREFAEYHFNEFDKKTQKELEALGVNSNEKK